MPWGVAAAAAVSAGASAYSSSQQSGATKKAANQSIAAQEAAEARLRADLAPYKAQGDNALMVAGALSGANGAEQYRNAMQDYFQADPGYAYSVSEGLKAVDAGAASRGLLRSGATLRAEQTLGTNLGNQQFGQFYNRLLGLAQMGQNASAQTGAGAMSAGQGIAQTAASAGAAQSQILGQEGQNYQQLIKNLYTGSQQSGGSMYGSQDGTSFSMNKLLGGTTDGGTKAGFAGAYPAQGYANQNVVDTGNYPTSGLLY